MGVEQVDVGRETALPLGRIKGYLVVNRERARQFEAQTAIPIETAAASTVHIQRLDDTEQQEVRLYRYPTNASKKNKALTNSFVSVSKRDCNRLPTASPSRAPRNA